MHQAATAAPPRSLDISVLSKPYTASARQIWGSAAGRVAEFGLINTYAQAMSNFTVGIGVSPC